MFCSVSIDVDPISCYYEIHALGESPAELRSRILCAALPRFLELFDEIGISATFFLVGQDVDVEALGEDAIAMRAAVRELGAMGHELANHSYSHPYAMARYSYEESRAEILRSHELLSELAGRSLNGFRAPGYDISSNMMEALVSLNYEYDSSVFPAPTYYVAKAAVMTALTILRRPSGAVMTNPRALLAPIEPYRPDAKRPWRRGQAPIVELPIAVTRGTRTPVIGTNMLMAPSFLWKEWLRGFQNRPFFNFELHAIDLCDASIDGLPKELVARQPDLRIPLSKKQERLRAVLRHVEQKGARFGTLASYVAELSHL